jgi:hypothetical protein
MSGTCNIGRGVSCQINIHENFKPYFYLRAKCNSRIELVGLLIFLI